MQIRGKKRNGFPPTQDRKVLLKILKKRSVPGILVLDDHKNAVYFNPTAHNILQRLNGSRRPRQKTDEIPADKIPDEISALYNDLRKHFNSSMSGNGHNPPALTTLINKKSYSCRGFFLDDPALSYPKVPHVMMLIEKVSQHRQIDLESLKERFGLTKRQMEILKPLGKGYSNQEIADALYISKDTVKGHIKHIMTRLKVNTRTEILSILFQPLILN